MGKLRTFCIPEFMKA